MQAGATDWLELDVLIFGGGVAGLWLLDELRRRGYAVLLLENAALGSAQTVASQGIIHGGLKYMFDGRLTPAASAIREMPVIWRECLSGRRQPDLSQVKVLSDCCYIWGTASLKSRLFVRGSAWALRAAPQPVPPEKRPSVLAGAPGTVLFVPEQVIDCVSLARSFAGRNSGWIAPIDSAMPPRFRRDETGRIAEVAISAAGRALRISARRIVFAAGEGNERLRALAGLSPGAMQRRPLHMLMVRGDLPVLFGHCVGGLKPRITVTTAGDRAGRRVWLVGGQIAENGVAMSAQQLVAFAAAELPACVPGLDLRGAEMATYRIDRAEAANPAGQRPDDVQTLVDANVITAWPTKLALAPRLAERVLEALAPPGGDGRPTWSGPSPPAAVPPWESVSQWFDATSAEPVCRPAS